MDFDRAFDRLIAHEGGYVNDPRDPGGETKFGIAKRSYPSLNIANLTRDDAKAIYRRDFWDVLANAHPAVKFQVFDFAVNSGIGTAIRKLQAAIGAADDGVWGKVSADKLGAMDLNDVLMRFAAQRLNYYTALSTWPTFGKGWARRVAGQLNYSAEDN